MSIDQYKNQAYYNPTCCEKPIGKLSCFNSSNTDCYNKNCGGNPSLCWSKKQNKYVVEKYTPKKIRQHPYTKINHSCGCSSGNSNGSDYDISYLLGFR